VTHLRKMMLEKLQRRNYSESTTRCYLRTVEDFARRFRCSPDSFGPGTHSRISSRVVLP
jgi:integrase/recombinase XerD